MSVAVHVFQAGLMHVRMCVLGSVVVRVGVFMGDVVVLMPGVCMGVGVAVIWVAVLVLVGMRRVVGVIGHVSFSLPELA